MSIVQSSPAPPRGETVSSAPSPVMSPAAKYRPYLDGFPLELPDRTWPEKRITAPPIWCSVDLRDGNQALLHPMNIAQKLEMFQALVDIGFKQIEVGFPAAAQVEFDFCRTLMDRRLIPDDVFPQVLTQARSHLIERTFEALDGARQAILHIYNSISELQRRVVFHMSREEIKQIAVRGVKLVKRLAEQTDTHVILEYSPESFTGTELDFSLEVCEAVIDVWEPTSDNKIILNLPATVEMATPNVHADQIEWFLRRVKQRENVILSLHPHNDRGTAVAAAELALMAGADRVEGTLFGNGERTGNVDIVTLALNMYSQGVDPLLDFSDINAVRRVTDRCTNLPVHPRHAYAGDLVFTAFSGSHQDAINKGMRARQQADNELWEVPYLPIDPQDLGRTYEKIIQINSQSGKGGVAYVMDAGFQRRLPKAMQPELAAVVQRHSEATGVEVSPETIADIFTGEYLKQDGPFSFVSFRSWSPEGSTDTEECLLTVEVNGERRELAGVGGGPIEAAKGALLIGGCPYFDVIDYREHARTAGADAEAVAYIQVETNTGVRRYGAGIDANTVEASVKALLSALNRVLRASHEKGQVPLGKLYVPDEFVNAMRKEFGCRLPGGMHEEFSTVVHRAAGEQGDSLPASVLWDVFAHEYLRRFAPYRFVEFRTHAPTEGPEECWLTLDVDGRRRELHGAGNGPIDACVSALLEEDVAPSFDVIDLFEDSRSRKEGAEAVAYVQIELKSGARKYGVGMDKKPHRAAVKALLCALNRASEYRYYSHAEFLGVMSTEFHCELPAGMHREFQSVMQKLTINPGARVSAAAVWNAFARQYLDRHEPYRLISVGVSSVAEDEADEVHLSVEADGRRHDLIARGDKPLDAVRVAMREIGCPLFEVVDFHEHARGKGAFAEAMAFVQVRLDGIEKFGAGADSSTTRALVKALICAVNRVLAKRSYPPSEAIHVLLAEFGCELPEAMYDEVRQSVSEAVEPDAGMPASFIWGLFSAEFLEQASPFRFGDFHSFPMKDSPQMIGCSLSLEMDGHPHQLQGAGNGPIDACVNALRQSVAPTLRLHAYEEHARTSGADAEAVAYVQVEVEEVKRFGVGIDRNTTRAAIRALLSAVNRTRV